MNKKAQTSAFFLFMVGVIIFIITFNLASPLIKSSDKIRGDMDCSNSSIATTEKISCTVVDTVAPFFLAILVGLGGMALTAKLVGA